MIENPEKVAARKAFLMSSVPDALRPTAAGDGEDDAASPPAGYPPLPRVSHVRQDGNVSGVGFLRFRFRFHFGSISVLVPEFSGLRFFTIPFVTV